MAHSALVGRRKSRPSFPNLQLVDGHVGWICALVRSLVSGGGSQLFLKSEEQSFHCRFDLCPDWMFESLDGPFPALEQGKLSWSYFLQALRALGNSHSFLLSAPSTLCSWDGETFHRSETENPGSGVTLQFHSIEPVDLAVLRALLFAAPLELSINGTSLGCLTHSPDHTFQEHYQALALSWLDGSPSWKLPPPRRVTSECPLLRLSEHFWSELPEQEVRALALLSSHLHYDDPWGEEAWSTKTSPSSVFWLKDGVVSSSEKLPLPKLCVSVSFLVAHDREPNKSEDRETILKTLGDKLFSKEVPGKLVDFDVRSSRRQLIAGIGAGFSISCLLGPGVSLAALPFAALGVNQLLKLFCGLPYLDALLNAHYERLQRAWESYRTSDQKSHS